jgi:hypothetical protein
MTMHPPPRGNSSAPDGCALAHVANEKAETAREEAREGYRSVYEALGRLVGEQAALRALVHSAFARLGVVESTAEELENTGVRNLREELAKAREQADGWKKWLLGIVSGVIVAVVAAIILAALHK